MTGTALHDIADTIRDLAAQMLTTASQLEQAASDGGGTEAETS